MRNHSGDLVADAERTPRGGTRIALQHRVVDLAEPGVCESRRRGSLESFAYDKPVMERLWSLSEEGTSFQWQLCRNRTRRIQQWQAVRCIPGSGAVSGEYA